MYEGDLRLRNKVAVILLSSDAELRIAILRTLRKLWCLWSDLLSRSQNGRAMGRLPTHVQFRNRSYAF